MEKQQQATRQTVFVIPPKVHLLDITGPAQIFHEAADNGAPVKLFFSTVFPGHTEAISSCALSFNHLVSFDQLSLGAGDLVFVPGMETSLLVEKNFIAGVKPFQQWLAEQHQLGVIICSVCTGAFLLGGAGLLDGRICTTHWEFTEQLEKQYPLAKILTNRLFVQQDNIYTSAGITSGIDLSLYLVEMIWGSHFAAKIAKEAVIYFRRTLEDPQLNVFTQYRNHINYRIHIVQDILTKSFNSKLTIGELSEMACMSGRNLTRLFKKTTGITVNEYVDQIRAEHAAKMLASGHTMQAAALHCGLKSTSRLRTLLKVYQPKNQPAVLEAGI